MRQKTPGPKSRAGTLSRTIRLAGLAALLVCAAGDAMPRIPAGPADSAGVARFEPPRLQTMSDYRLRPAAVDFGAVPRRALAAAPAAGLLLTFPHGAARILSVESSLDWLDVRVSPSSGAAREFRIEAAARASDRRAKPARGQIGGALRIRTSDPVFPSIYVPVLGSIR